MQKKISLSPRLILIIILSLLASLALISDLKAVFFFPFGENLELEVIPSFQDISPTPILKPEDQEKATADWKVFRSSDESFRFLYPSSWKAVMLATSSGVLGVSGFVLQAWTVANYDFSQNTGNIPKEAVRIDFEIVTEGKKQSLEEFLDCNNANILECTQKEINGVTYQTMKSRNRFGGETLVAIAIKDNKIYKISGLIRGDSNKQGKEEMEKIINSFEIIQTI
ncbi:MAG: hypothetical protein M1514_04085 [Patescibacteria group bacterium]|nr:hypothetical protein [Patescibacteria group bacterium]